MRIITGSAVERIRAAHFLHIFTYYNLKIQTYTVAEVKFYSVQVFSSPIFLSDLIKCIKLIISFTT